MRLKRYGRYQMALEGNWMKASMACIGLSVVMLGVYYLMWLSPSAWKPVNLIFGLLLPVAASLTYVILGRIVRLNAPGVYAILGAVFCILLIVGSFFSGSILRIILAVIWYLLTAVVLLASAGGYLPGKLPASLMFGAALLVRLLAFDLPRLRRTNWIEEGAMLLILVGLACLPKAFKSVRES